MFGAGRVLRPLPPQETDSGPEDPAPWSEVGGDAAQPGLRGEACRPLSAPLVSARPSLAKRGAFHAGSQRPVCRRRGGGSRSRRGRRARVCPRGAGGREVLSAAPVRAALASRSPSQAVPTPLSSPRARARRSCARVRGDKVSRQRRPTRSWPTSLHSVFIAMKRASNSPR